MLCDILAACFGIRMAWLNSALNIHTEVIFLARYFGGLIAERPYDGIFTNEFLNLAANRR